MSLLKLHNNVPNIYQTDLSTNTSLKFLCIKHLIKRMKLRWVVLSFIFYRVSASVSTSDFRFSEKDFMANPICGLIFSVKRQCSLALCEIEIVYFD